MKLSEGLSLPCSAMASWTCLFLFFAMGGAASLERDLADPHLLCDFSKYLTLSEPLFPLLTNANLGPVERAPEPDRLESWFPWICFPM